MPKTHRRIALPGSAVALSVAALTLAGCSHEARVDQVVRELGLTRGPGHTYLSPQGCRIALIIIGRTQVRLYRDDDHTTVFSRTRHSDVALKAVGMTPSCKRSLRRLVARLP